MADKIDYTDKEYDKLLNFLGFKRKLLYQTFFFNGKGDKITIEGVEKNSLREIIHFAIEEGKRQKAKEIRESLNI